MAYAYSQIDDMMGNGSQQNQNIFSQSGTTGSQNQDVTSANANVKTDTSGDIGNASPTAMAGSQPPKVSASSTQQDRQNTQRAISANVGKTQKPAALEAVQGEIDSAKSGLQQKAADYAAQQQQKQNYAVDNSTLDKAITGDSASAAKTSDLLSRSTYNPVDSFDYGDISVKDAPLLANNAGIQQLVSKGQGPTYNKNMAAFDAMLLQMDPAFQNQVSGLKKQAGDLQGLADTTKTNAESAANMMAQNNLTSAQQQAKNYLTQQQQAIANQNQAEADAQNQLIKNQDVAGITAKAKQDAMAKVQAQLDQIYGTGRASSQLANVNVDPTQFFTAHGPASADQFFSADDAARYNMINQLMGNGGQAATASGDFGPLYNIDQNGLYNALFTPASQARQTQDVQDQKDIQSILDQAQSFANQDLASRQKAISAQSGQAPVAKIITDYLNSGNANIDNYYKTNPDALVNTISNFETQYAQQNPLNPGGALTINDVLNKDQADKLNSLMLDLKGAGNYNPYQVGQYASGMPTPGYDANAVQAAFKDFLAGNIPSAPPKPGPGPIQTGRVGINRTGVPTVGPGTDVGVNNGGTLNKITTGINNAESDIGQGWKDISKRYF
jgi:hypothetical protein